MGGTVGASPRAPNPAAVDVQAAAAAAAAPAPSPSSSPVGPASDTGVTVTVTVIHDGRSDSVTTQARSVGELIQEMGLHLSSLDKITPSTTASLTGVTTIRLVRVTQTTERQSITVAFRQLTKSSDKVELGTESLGQGGANGLTVKVFRQTFQDGRLVSTVLVSTNVVRAPRDEIKLIGTHQPPFTSHGGSETGMATWYGTTGLSAASPTLPFGTVVKVTNVATGRSINVVIRDRGPFAGSDRVIDLSPTAFAQIGALGSGVISVTVQW